MAGDEGEMMRFLVLGLKGVVYGITHIVPGLGGGLILILMGIYEQFVDSLGNILVDRRRWRERLAFLVPLGLGMVVGMIVLAKLIETVIARFPAATMFFFMGLLLGTVPTVLKMHGDMRITPARVLLFLGGIALVVGLRFLGRPEDHFASLSATRGLLYNTVISFLAGGASVTPGLDGSYVLLVGGTYGPIIEAVSALSSLKIQWGILITTGVGAVLGIAGFSKLIDTAIKRAAAPAYFAILGLIVGSIYGLWPKVAAREGPVVLIAVFIVGAAIAVLFGGASQHVAGDTE